MKLKRFLAGILCGLMVVGITACGRGAESLPNSKAANTASQSTGEKLKVGLSIAMRDQWLSSMETAAKAAAQREGVDFTVYDANNDFQKQLSHVQTMASQSFDVMIVNLTNTDNAPEIISAAGNIPIVFVNRFPGEANLVDNKIVYVGSDENTTGTLQAKYLTQYFKDEGKSNINYVLLMGKVGLQSVTTRTSSVKKALGSSGLKFNEIYEDTAQEDRATAQEKMQQFIGSGKKFDAVICNDDEMALGAIVALKSANIKVPVVGIDGTSSGLQAIKSGDMGCTVYQNAVGQGEGMIAAAKKLGNGESCKKLNWVPFELVTKDNVDKYIKITK